jgi:hypothetical protein
MVRPLCQDKSFVCLMIWGSRGSIDHEETLVSTYFSLKTMEIRLSDSRESLEYRVHAHTEEGDKRV